MFRLELEDAHDGDEGSYVRVLLGAGDVEVSVQVSDGLGGQKVQVLLHEGNPEIFSLTPEAS